MSERAQPGSGLAALYAALDDARARHRLTGFAIAVDDPELGCQVFTTGPDAAAALEGCGPASGRAWCSVPELAQEPSEVPTLRAFAATALRLGVLDPTVDDVSALEIALRRVADVGGIYRSGRVIHALPTGDGHAAIVGLLHEHATTVPVVVVEPGAHTVRRSPAVAGSGDRVELVAVLSRPDTHELEVHLRSGDERTVGRGPLSRAATGAAEATLAALAQLGLCTDDRIAWARTFDTTPEREFLVGVAVSAGDGPTRYGFAPGSSPVESAARATLDAVNRSIHRARRGEERTADVGTLPRLPS